MLIGKYEIVYIGWKLSLLFKFVRPGWESCLVWYLYSPFLLIRRYK